MGWTMVHSFLGIDEKNTEKSIYIQSEYPCSVFEHPDSVSNQKPRDYPPCHHLCKPARAHIPNATFQVPMSLTSRDWPLRSREDI